MAWTKYLLAVALLAACGPEDADKDPNVEGDADTDADTDTDTNADTDTDTTDTDTTDTDTDTTDTDTDTDPPFGTPEICDDTIDNDLDGDRDCRDSDCDPICDADGDSAITVALGGTDCDDADPDINPGADEICDGIDNDCDTRVDDDDNDLDPVGAYPQWRDQDLDGYGRMAVVACTLLPGNVENSDDCDDMDAAFNPAAPELCNRQDDDCDALVDDADPSIDPALFTTFYADADRDGTGDPLAPVDSCFAGINVTNDDDCDDLDPTFSLPVDWYADADGDGVGGGAAVELGLCAPVNPRNVMSSDDCDPADDTIYPDAPEVCLDGIDQDCNGLDDCHLYLEGEALASASEVLLYGDAANQLAGTAVAMADADGDGDLDLLEVSSAGSALAGTKSSAHIWSGPWEDGMYALSTSGIVISGETPGSSFSAIGMTGDITGDGLDDLYIGDPAFAGSSGRTYVIAGPVTAGGEVALLATATLDGPAASLAGSEIVTADLGGDGETSLWISAINGAGAGAVYVTSGALSGNSLLGTDGLIGLGADTVDVASMGADDFDGDGLPEMALGSPTALAGRGITWIWAHDPVGVEDPTSSDLRIEGTGVNAGFGTIAVPAGDQTGDGLPDLLVTAPGANGADGAAYIYAGPLTAAGADIEIRGFDGFGGTGAVAGDVDADGRVELLIGTSVGGNDQYLIDIDGATGVITDAAVTQFILRDDRTDLLGVNSAHGGDLDGDGFDDMALGGRNIDSPGGNNSGGVRLLFGYPLLK